MCDLSQRFKLCVLSVRMLYSLLCVSCPPLSSQLEMDDKELRRTITISIKNQLGVRVGLFTPDMAFEDVVKEQIRKLVQPAMKCIDMVSTELGEVIQRCGEGVSLCVKV